MVFDYSVVFLAFACTKNSGGKAPEQVRSGPITLVIHGGAGTILRSNMSAESEAAYHQKLQDALDTGFAVLENGGKSLEAVIAAIKILEDSPLFNAGKGAVLTHDGRNELDASIMDGSNLMAGAIAGVTTIKIHTAAYAKHSFMGIGVLESHSNDDAMAIRLDNAKHTLIIKISNQINTSPGLLWYHPRDRRPTCKSPCPKMSCSRVLNTATGASHS